jgi:hypothetical protein
MAFSTVRSGVVRRRPRPVRGGGINGSITAHSAFRRVACIAKPVAPILRASDFTPHLVPPSSHATTMESQNTGITQLIYRSASKITLCVRSRATAWAAPGPPIAARACTAATCSGTGRSAPNAVKRLYRPSRAATADVSFRFPASAASAGASVRPTVGMAAISAVSSIVAGAIGGFRGASGERRSRSFAWKVKRSGC